MVQCFDEGRAHLLVVLVSQDWTCKIADFGLANVMRKDKEYHDRKFLPGSLPYMAPEVLSD